MNKKLLSYVIILACAGLFLAGGQSLLAQESDVDAFMLEEVTVTATKRAENKQNVPIAMEVMSGEDLQTIGSNDVNEILQNVSNVVVNKTGQNLRISLRGVSDDQPEGQVQMSAPTVAVNTDGIMSNRQSSGMGLFDIERVEVLYGPQSTLYASATPGGIVNIISASPKLDTYSASGTIEYGSYELLHTEGAMNIPVAETLALRAAFNTSVRDGYLSNGGDDEDTKAGRIKALYQPSENLSFEVTGEISKTSNRGFAGVVRFGKESEVDDPWTAASEDAANSRNIQEKKIYGTMNWDVGFTNVALTPSYMESKEPESTQTMENMFGQMETSISSRDSWEKSVELRLTSSEDFFFKWIAGFVYYKSQDIANTDVVDGTGYNHKKNFQETKAFYGNVTYPLTDALRATGGVRLSNDTNDSYNDESPGGPGKVYPETTHMKYDNPDYKVGLEYDLTETMMLYTDYSTSYRSQGMLFDADGNQFPPEELRAINLGAKSRFFENRLQVNAATYYYDYQNYGAISGYQYVLFEDLNGDGIYSTGMITYVDENGVEREGQEIQAAMDENGKTYGDMENMGLDLQMTAILSDKDKVDVSVSYMHNEITNLVFDLMEITNSQGIPDQDYKGKSATFSPEWTITAAYNRQFNLPDGSILTARLDGRYKSDYICTFVEKEIYMDTDNADPANGYFPLIVKDVTEARYQEPFYQFNCSATYTNPDGKWSLTAYGKNLTNYAYKTSWISMGEGTLMIGPPRTFGAVLSVRF